MTGKQLELIQNLRKKFDDWLVAEVNKYGGIPPLPKEEVELREAIAELLFELDK